MEESEPAGQDFVIGRVVWFSSDRGYGFIKVNGFGEVFCHYSAIRGNGVRSLQKDQKVELLVLKGKNGLYAAQVEVVT